MPFALPEYDEAFAVFLQHTVRELARARSPLLGQIQFGQQSTTVASQIRTRDGTHLDLPEEIRGSRCSKGQ
jgi:hypothetical protein